MKRRFDWRGALAFAAIVALIGFIAWGILATVRPAVGAELRRGEAELLARVVQAESTGQPAEGQRAVAWTALNRLREPEVYGGTITKVLQRPHQYAKPMAGPDNTDAYLRAMHATVSALLGIGGDPSNSSTHFARCDVRPRPVWMRTFDLRAKISAHCFFRKR